MAKIEGFRIKNYRELKAVSIGKLWNQQDAKPLTPMTADTGKNGVSKSTLFETLKHSELLKLLIHISSQDEESEAFKAGYRTIVQISNLRIRRAGKKIKEGNDVPDLDTGFRVLTVDSSNMAAVYYTPDTISQEGFCKELARRKPLRAVFRDVGFKDDSAKINVEQIFKLLSPHTEVKTI